MYHRIADAELDPWDIKVSADSFEKQVRYIRENMNPIPLSALNEESGELESPVVISFDDGYLDNYTTAKPILEKYQVPASFFITSSRIGKAEGFWWDRLAHIFLEKKSLPVSGEVIVDQKKISFELGADANLTAPQQILLRHWKANEAAPNKRAEVFYSIWRALKFSVSGDQEDVIDYLENWSGSPEYSAPLMSWNQIREISHHELFSVGGHSVNHFLLDLLGEKEQYQEINENRKTIQGQIGKKVNSFAAPFGGYNHHTLEILKNAGIELALTTHHEPTNLEEILKNPLEIPRIQVKDNTHIDRL